MQLITLAKFSLWLLISMVIDTAFTGTPSSAQPAAVTQTESQTVSMPISQQNDETSTPEPRRSYIGVGATIGLSEPDEAGFQTGLGKGGFSIISRAGLTENLGLHTVAIFGDKFTGNLAFTVRLPVKSGESGSTLFEPFIGPGVIIEESEVSALVSTGADIPLSKDFTTTARLNIGFPNGNTDVGIIVGLGYNFKLF
ncbi:MAG: hypothetical protein NW237_05600 [Cyanobacteriota bacterium]|nr:hypothetical protein [Cyanobacteriota bacterium]